MLDVTRLRVIDAVARHGSVTAAAKELHYSQPSVSHHLARLEAETGAQLLQRVGRGIRLTQAGQLLADRAAEIIGRIDAADAELSAHVGLTAGRVRLAGFSSAIGSLVPRAMAALASRHPDLQITPDRHAPARGAGAAARRQGRRRGHLPLRRNRARARQRPPAPPARRSAVPAVDRAACARLAALRDATWIAGCDRCRSHLLSLCADEGFEPRIGYTSDDMVVMQALVAAGLGVTTIPGLALQRPPSQGHRRHRAAGVAPARLRRDLRRAARPARDNGVAGGARRGRAPFRRGCHTLTVRQPPNQIRCRTDRGS